MIPKAKATVIFRYEFGIEAVMSALGLDAVDSEDWRASFDGGTLVIDLISPAGQATETPADEREPAPAVEGQPEAASPQAAALAGEAGKIPAEGGERKTRQGRLAQKAGIICAEGAFQAWTETADEEAAAAWVRKQCGVKSRRELDTNKDAGEWFEKKIATPYALWLDGD